MAHKPLRRVGGAAMNYPCEYCGGMGCEACDPWCGPPEPSPPEPSAEDQCEGMGHPEYGADRFGPRCYCGRVRYLIEALALLLLLAAPCQEMTR